MALRVLASSSGRGCLLDHLLVATLDGAFRASPQVEDVAVLVAQHLDLDVGAGFSMNFSTKMRSSPKLDLASERADPKPSSASLALKATRMPLPPPPADGLDHDGIADLGGDLDRMPGIRDLAPDGRARWRP